MTRRPALSALAVRMAVNWPQPASRIARLSPAFCATVRPGASMVPLAEAVMLATRRSSSPSASQASTRARAVLWWKSRRRLRTLRHSLVSTRRSRLRFPEPGSARSLRRCKSVSVAWAVSRNPGVGDHFPVRGREEADHTHIDADRPACRRQRLGLGLHHDDDVPAAVLPLQLERLHPAHDLPMLLHFQATDRLKGCVRPAGALGRLPPGAVSGDEQDLVESLVGLEPGVASLLSGPDTPKEGTEGRMQATEGLLLGGERVPTLPVRISRADLPELCRLIAVGDAQL